jgi:MFS family permease
VSVDSKAISRRLHPLYTTAFLQGFAPWYAIEKLFQQSIGFSDLEITTVTSVYIFVMLAANIPMGVLADRWSRTGVLYVATFALIGSSTVIGLSHSFWTYAVGISLWGLFFACQRGTFTAIVYDVCLEIAETAARDYDRCSGRVQSCDFGGNLAGALSSVLVVYFLTLRWAFFLTVPFTVCALVSLKLFREPQEHRKEEESRLRDHLGQIVHAMTTKATVTWVVLCLVLDALALRLIFEFQGLWFLGLRLPAVWYGPGTALLCSGAALGGIAAGKLGASHRSAAIVGIFAVATTTGLFIRSPVAVIAAQATTMCGIVVLQVVLGHYLHDELLSNIRTGASSVADMLGDGAFIPVAIGFGLMARDQGIFRASWFVTGALASLSLTLSLVALTRARSKGTDARDQKGTYDVAY